MPSTQDLISIAAAHHTAGRLTEAEATYRQLLADHPDDLATLVALADVLTDANRPAEAEPLYRQVIAQAPDAPKSSGAYDGIAAICQDRGDIDGAVFASKKAAHLRGDADDAFAIASTLEQLGRGDDAMEMFALAVSLRPGFADAHHKLAGHLRVRGQTQESLRHYRLSVEAKPQSAEFICNLANALRLAGDEDAALINVRRALELKPDLAEAHNVMGTIWVDRRRPSDALASFNKALQLKPDFADAINNIGSVMEQVGRIEEAGTHYERAVSIKPDEPEFHGNLAANLLLRGQFERGWYEAEWRRRNSINPASRPFGRPMWDGSNLEGKSILLHAEQGLGDTIQFLRYASQVRDQGGKVIVECQPMLVPLTQAVDGVQQVVAVGQPWPEFEVQCALMSLPIIFRTNLANIPATIPYITAEAEKMSSWAAKLKDTSGKRLGIVWAGSPTHKNNKARSCAPAKLLPLAQVPGISLVSLQKGSAPAAPAELNLLDLTADLTDFSETAALIANLDLVITVDTSIAHLAGAMGKPVWILLPAVPDWRWLLARDDSPWYPTARLFRQSAPGDWTSVIRRVCEELGKI